MLWQYFVWFQSLEYQLGQSQKLAEMYREQVIQLEDELSRIREEGDVTREIFKVWKLDGIIHESGNVKVVIFAVGKFCENVGKTFHVGEIFMILLLFPS